MASNVVNPVVTHLRVEELKQSLMLWRHILLPVNNLLRWKNNRDPLIIFSVLTLVFYLIFQANPSVLTLSSCLVLLIFLVDLLAPVGATLIFKDAEWTSADETEYTDLCRRIAHLEQHVKSHCDSIFQMRREQPTTYFVVGGICLVFIAFCGQCFNNLLLCYLMILLACLIPGVRHRQLFSFIWHTKAR